jgi:hypothetical protein
MFGKRGFDRFGGLSPLASFWAVGLSERPSGDATGGSCIGYGFTISPHAETVGHVEHKMSKMTKLGRSRRGERGAGIYRLSS